MALEIELSRQAQAMLHEADERWVAEHGLGADNPLLDEIARAADLIRDNPEIGVIYRHQVFGLPVRRLLLRSGWHLYYTHDAGRAVVVVVAVWYSTRGTEPPL